MKIDCADAITLITGKLFVSVDRLYELYNAMTGDNLFTHQLSRAYKACAPQVRKELPDLTASLRATYGADENWEKCDWYPKWEKALENARKVFGDSFEVTPLTAFEHVDPLEERAETHPLTLCICGHKFSQHYPGSYYTDCLAHDKAGRFCKCKQFKLRPKRSAA